MLAISVIDQREFLDHYEWIKRGKGTLGAQVLEEKSTS